MTGRVSFLAGGTFCEVFCEAMNVEFSSIDYEEPRRSILNLGISGNRGCPKCHLLYEACVQLYPLSEEETARVMVRLLDSFGWVQLYFDIVGESLPNPKGSFYDPSDVYLYYLYKSPQPDWISLSPFRKPLTCRQDQFQELLIDWLDDCESNHASCQRPDTPLPTRVINVGDDMGKEPFLYVSNGEQSRYVALSHCWGEVLLIKTEKTNFATHQKGVPFSTLPKNFKDAITVARAIGVQYVWIDSLCIIQDDGHDWEIESSKMASIYQNAHIVLVASNAADSQGGLWNAQWDDYGQTDGVVELPYQNADGRISDIIARKTMSHEDIIPESYLEYEAPSPLSKRAWTLQEELLASRCIFFTAKELLWKCQNAQKCECMQEDIEYTMRGSGERSLWESAKSQGSTKRFGDWRSLMAYYSKRHISFESDRLPAISGMAKHMQSKNAGEYLAGIWKNDLCESLLWLPRPVWRDVTNDNLTSTYRRRATPYRAPTWSWISLETHGDGKDKSRCPGIVDWQEGRYWYLQKAHVRVVDACCEPAGMDPTGTVKSGYILLEGKCLEAWVTWESRNSQMLYGKVPLSVHWDIDLEIGLRQKVCCILIGDAITDEDIKDKRPVRALVLRRSKTVAGAFERIGLFNGDNLQGTKLDLFGEANDSFVTIV